MTEKSLKIGIVMDPIDAITPYKDSSLAMLLEGIRDGVRHTFVRVDFSSEDWWMRETTFFAGAGTLYALHMDDADHIRLEEVDGERLKRALSKAIGPLTPREEAPTSRTLRDFLLSGRAAAAGGA
jgi:hypothetical protein